MTAAVLSAWQQAIRRAHCDSPYTKSSDEMQYRVIALKYAAGQAALLESQHLIILMFSCDLSEPSSQRNTCSRPQTMLGK